MYLHEKSYRKTTVWILNSILIDIQELHTYQSIYISIYSYIVKLKIEEITINEDSQNSIDIQIRYEIIPRK